MYVDDMLALIAFAGIGTRAAGNFRDQNLIHISRGTGNIKSLLLVGSICTGCSIALKHEHSLRSDSDQSLIEGDGCLLSKSS